MEEERALLFSTPLSATTAAASATAAAGIAAAPSLARRRYLLGQKFYE